MALLREDDDNESCDDVIGMEIPDFTWKDIGGIAETKETLQHRVIFQLKFPKIFKGVKGILLYGAPGTGKTFIAKACAKEAGGAFFSIWCPHLVSKHILKSERVMWKLFEKARKKKPSLILIDEIDVLFGRDFENDASKKAKFELMVQMQILSKEDQEGIVVVATTNVPWALDKAILRRFEKRIHIPLPDYEARLFILKTNLKINDCHTLTEKDIQEIAEKTDGFSASDLILLVRDAVLEPIRRLCTPRFFEEVQIEGKKLFKSVESGKTREKEIKFGEVSHEELLIPEATIEDMFHSLEKVKPSVSSKELKEYHVFKENFG